MSTSPMKPLSEMTTEEVYAELMAQIIEGDVRVVEPGIEDKYAIWAYEREIEA